MTNGKGFHAELTTANLFSRTSNNEVCGPSELTAVKAVAARVCGVPWIKTDGKVKKAGLVFLRAG